jgi:hypothetical protein
MSFIVEWIESLLGWDLPKNGTLKQTQLEFISTVKDLRVSFENVPEVDENKKWVSFYDLLKIRFPLERNLGNMLRALCIHQYVYEYNEGFHATTIEPHFKLRVLRNLSVSQRIK